ncbi:hypothetical protein [Jiangella sp. DSM 45060]|uniref:hypothetical protein n=1 Tax=Jiangella sp. DSM 45060 TaxID=1798224 RepID=UPI00087C0D37|nr:hypothetical protein [Jiangella sp. DSM 45060]SDT69546.1 hypothetical protein SAMN04515669_6037 [Jiangella sp. DSM 45060]
MTFHIDPAVRREMERERRANLTPEQRTAEDADREAQHAANIDLARLDLLNALTIMETDHATAVRALETLGDPELYDVEFAEGTVGADISRHLAAAGLAIRSARAIAGLVVAASSRVTA